MSGGASWSVIFALDDQVPVVVKGRVAIIITIEIDFPGLVGIGMGQVAKLEAQTQKFFFVDARLFGIFCEQGFEDAAVFRQDVVNISQQLVA